MSKLRSFIWFLQDKILDYRIQRHDSKECEHGTPWRYVLNCEGCIGELPDEHGWDKEKSGGS